MGCITSIGSCGLKAFYSRLAASTPPTLESQISKIEKDLQPQSKVVDLDHCYVCGRASTHTATDDKSKKVGFCQKCIKPSVGLPCLHGIKRIPKEKRKVRSHLRKNPERPQKLYESPVYHELAPESTLGDG